MISCITTILDGVSLAYLTWELVSVPVAWSKSHCSLPVQISEKSAAKWDSNAVVPLVLILPLLVALGISQMPPVEAESTPAVPRHWSPILPQISLKSGRAENNGILTMQPARRPVPKLDGQVKTHPRWSLCMKS